MSVNILGDDSRFRIHISGPCCRPLQPNLIGISRRLRSSPSLSQSSRNTLCCWSVSAIQLPSTTPAGRRRRPRRHHTPAGGRQPDTPTPCYNFLYLIWLCYTLFYFKEISIVRNWRTGYSSEPDQKTDYYKPYYCLEESESLNYFSNNWRTPLLITFMISIILNQTEPFDHSSCL